MVSRSSLAASTLLALTLAATPATAQTNDDAEAAAVEMQFHVAVGLHWTSAVLGTFGGAGILWGISTIATYGDDHRYGALPGVAFFGGIPATSIAFILLCVAIGLDVDAVSRRDALRRRAAVTVGPGDLGLALSLALE